MSKRDDLLARIASSRRTQPQRRPGQGLGQGISTLIRLMEMNRQRERQENIDQRSAWAHRQRKKQAKWAEEDRKTRLEREEADSEHTKLIRKLELADRIEEKEQDERLANTAGLASGSDIENARLILTRQNLDPSVLSARAATLSPEELEKLGIEPDAFDLDTIKRREAELLEGADPADSEAAYLGPYHRQLKAQMERAVAAKYITPKEINKLATLFANHERLEKYPDNPAVWDALDRVGISTTKLKAIAADVGAKTVAVTDSGHLAREAEDGLRYFQNQQDASGQSVELPTVKTRAVNRFKHWKNKILAAQSQNMGVETDKDSKALNEILKMSGKVDTGEKVSAEGINKMASALQTFAKAMRRVPTQAESAVRDLSYRMGDGTRKAYNPKTGQWDTLEDPAAAQQAAVDQKLQAATLNFKAAAQQQKTAVEQAKVNNETKKLEIDNLHQQNMDDLQLKSQTWQQRLQSDLAAAEESKAAKNQTVEPEEPSIKWRGTTKPSNSRFNTEGFPEQPKVNLP